MSSRTSSWPHMQPHKRQLPWRVQQPWAHTSGLALSAPASPSIPGGGSRAGEKKGVQEALGSGLVSLSCCAPGRLCRPTIRMYAPGRRAQPETLREPSTRMRDGRGPLTPLPPSARAEKIFLAACGLRASELALRGSSGKSTPQPSFPVGPKPLYAPKILTPVLTGGYFPHTK